MAQKDNNSSDDNSRTRILRLLLLLLEQPNIYNKEQIVAKLGTSSSTIDTDFQILRSLGINLEFSPKPQYRYSIVLSKAYSNLNHLLHFSQDELEDLYQSVEAMAISDKRKNHLKGRLSTQYNFKRLGYANLREPNLEKLDNLQKAINEQKRVWLMGYSSSSSNTVANRLVEPFKLDLELDTVHTFDVEKKKLSHFKITRAASVKVEEESSWAFKTEHYVRQIDPFGIVNDNQINIHLRLKVGARNELLERFPVTRRYILDSSRPKQYDFQCMVNAEFLGLTNFILGFYHQGIEIIEGTGLRAALRKAVSDMDF